MRQTKTLTEVADEIGCNRSTVSRQAKKLGVGTPVGKNVIVLTAAEIKKLAKIIRPRTKKGE